MKITDLKVSDPIYVPFKPMTDAINTVPTAMTYTFLYIMTDEDITGLSINYSGKVAQVIIEDLLKPVIIGEDPINSERIWEKMYWATLQYGRRGIAISAISTVDMAVWDLKGKIFSMPVHRLLGGHRDSVPSYVTGVDLHYTNEELIKEVNEYVKMGFKMIKLKLGRKDPNEDLERVKLVRQTIGPDIDLTLDVNNGWSLHTAMRMARKLEEYDIFWLEEPILADEIENLAKLARETSIPIAVGENHYTKWEFRQLMEQGAAEVVQADIGKCGGVTEFIKIAAIADSFGLPICPHHTEYVDASLVAAVPNGLFHECVYDFFEPMGQLFINPSEPKNGEISPSDKPGFGFELNEETIKKWQTKPSPEKMRWIVKKGWRWPPYL